MSRSSTYHAKRMAAARWATGRNPHLARALSNGISQSTYHRRVRQGWTPEAACSTLPSSKAAELSVGDITRLIARMGVKRA